MTALVGAGLLLLAALLPRRLPHATTARAALGAVGVLALLPAAGSSGAWPFVLLAAGAAALGSPLALGLAAAGAAAVGLRPEASAPLAAAAAGLGVAGAADALESTLRARRGGGGEPDVPALVAGCGLAVALLSIDHQAVLSWTFGVGEGEARVALPGVGLALGGGLLLAVGGALLLGAGILAPAEPARRAGRALLGAAAAASGGGLALALIRSLSLQEPMRAAAARPLAVLVALAATLAVLLADRADTLDGRDPAPRAALFTRVAVSLALVAALVAGIESWWRAGAYATELTAAAVAASLLGLAALEAETQLVAVRRGLLLAALLWLALA